MVSLAPENNVIEEMNRLEFFLDAIKICVVLQELVKMIFVRGKLDKSKINFFN